MDQFSLPCLKHHMLLLVGPNDGPSFAPKIGYTDFPVEQLAFSPLSWKNEVNYLRNSFRSMPPRTCN